MNGCPGDFVKMSISMAQLTLSRILIIVEQSGQAPLTPLPPILGGRGVNTTKLCG